MEPDISYWQNPDVTSSLPKFEIVGNSLRYVYFEWIFVIHGSDGGRMSKGGGACCPLKIKTGSSVQSSIAFH